ncbi:DUF456 domain-containing protein [Sinomonas sp. ASV322]|uniref:DUF456 domain-containing protein n=1 Tax=Sinomonas sp. ASV322 TaxID=3041920 RepID=UPI0027DD89FC|nr:DUF456 domain-containing protein [Sinomonas sp. ASV322]MDQ4503403.1 DUF456 domain-containing protein [Sinomonas sp. ASV322]
MDGPALAALLTGLALAVAVAGTIVPVLPGSVLGILALLEWALFGGSGAGGWIVFAIGTTFFAAGMAASYVLTGRKLAARGVPSGSVVIAAVAAIVGLFVAPVVGPIVGFVVGLLGSEWARTRDLRAASSSSFAALKAVGLGRLVEFACAAVAVTVWVVGAWLYFSNR